MVQMVKHVIFNVHIFDASVKAEKIRKFQHRKHERYKVRYVGTFKKDDH